MTNHEPASASAPSVQAVLVTPSHAEGRSAGVFVIGCPRSGTSILSWSLAAHHNFWTSAESYYLLDLFGSAKLHAAFKRAASRPDGGWLTENNVGYTYSRSPSRSILPATRMTIALLASEVTTASEPTWLASKCALCSRN